MFEPEGEHVSKKAEEILKLVKHYPRINMLFGSREGIPEGVYRFADLVLDIAPGITLSTEYAAASALIAIASVIHDYLAKEEEQEANKANEQKQ